VRIEREPFGNNGDGRLIALDLEGGEGAPVVHGWLGREAGAGEYSMINEGPTGPLASRDAFGTRPLYRAASGRWVASDHRFFPEELSVMLPPGAELRLSDGSTGSPTTRKKEFTGSYEEACENLAHLIDTSVKDRVEGARRVAIAFSGGLDSSILAHCARGRTKVVACSAAAPGSVDYDVAGEAARAMGLDFVPTKLEESDVAKELEALDLPFKPSLMDRGLWCIYSITSRAAAEAGAELIMLGQLADELFGGYAKYETALQGGGEEEAARMMAEDVAGCGVRGFIRDEAACSRWLEPRFPFADPRVAEFGAALPVEFKIRKGFRKSVLSGAAVKLGLPEEMAWRPKKAAQYSSGILKLLG